MKDLIIWDGCSLEKSKISPIPRALRAPQVWAEFLAWAIFSWLLRIAAFLRPGDGYFSLPPFIKIGLQSNQSYRICSCRNGTCRVWVSFVSCLVSASLVQNCLLRILPQEDFKKVSAGFVVGQGKKSPRWSVRQRRNKEEKNKREMP